MEISKHGCHAACKSYLFHVASWFQPGVHSLLHPVRPTLWNPRLFGNIVTYFTSFFGATVVFMKMRQTWADFEKFLSPRMFAKSGCFKIIQDRGGRRAPSCLSTPRSVAGSAR